MSAAVTFAKRMIAELEASERANSSSTRDLLKALVDEIEALNKKLEAQTPPRS